MRLTHVVLCVAMGCSLAENAELEKPRNTTSAAPPLFQCVRGRCLRLMRTEVLSGFGCFEYCQLFSCLVTGGPASQKSSEERFLVCLFFVF